MRIECDKCKNDNMKVKHRQCSGCENNGAWLEDPDTKMGDWIYDQKRIDKEGLERTQATSEGECYEGVANDKGCVTCFCNVCGHTTAGFTVEEQLC